jgi:N-methylhydantoinase A
VPGPACYGRGGDQPTVTDAAFFLGMLGEGRLASGIALDADKARAALSPLATRLGFDEEEVARGIMTIAAANMANAIREITIERGRDPRTARLMPFGGAGPLFGTLLARELEIREIVVPPYAGNFSAWGLLGADLTQTAARTRIMRLSDDAVATGNALLREMFAELESRAAGRDHVREIALDMRYAGQEHTLTVTVAGDEAMAVGADEIRSAFTADYDRTFGHLIDEEIEIVSLRATIRTELPRRAVEHAAQGTPFATKGGAIEAWSFARSERLEFAIVDRASIGPDGLDGPAIVLEETATTYLDADFHARPGAGGILAVSDSKEA